LIIRPRAENRGEQLEAIGNIFKRPSGPLWGRPGAVGAAQADQAQ
jgi:hypothetical protein